MSSKNVSVLPGKKLKMSLTRYGHWGSERPQPHENFEAMQILRQCAWIDKVPLHKKHRRKIN